LPQGLTVLVTDQYGNPVPGVDVDFDDGGAGGTYAYANPGVTSNAGTVTQFYTLPASPKTITITATATGVTTPAVFTETAN
jgi:protocatechuate 3,4-dioxygenase beta subunit